MMYKPPTIVMIHDSQNTEVMLRVEGKYPTLFEIWEKELKIINVDGDANQTIPRKKCNLYLVFYRRSRIVSGVDDTPTRRRLRQSKSSCFRLFCIDLPGELSSEKDVGMGHCQYIDFCFIPTLFAYFLACHPYIFLHF